MVDLVTLSPSTSLLSKSETIPKFPAEKQIVTPPDQSELTPPRETNLLSDLDFATKREQIRRGDSPEAGPLVAPGMEATLIQRAPSPPAEATQRAPTASKRSATAPLDLALDQSLLREAVRQGQRPTTGGAPSPRPFSRAPGSGARFLGINGMADYLPHLPDGDITLLNAKAEKFAVFVRRVATQVFYQIKLQGWGLVRAQDIEQAKEYTVIRAVLSPEGDLISATVEQPSGSRRFDDAIQSAVEKGARDPHPPPESAGADGNFRFIFMARSWVQSTSDPRSGMPMERRWLLLKTGLE